MGRLSKERLDEIRDSFDNDWECVDAASFYGHATSDLLRHINVLESELDRFRCKICGSYENVHCFKIIKNTVDDTHEWTAVRKNEDGSEYHR